MITMSNETPAPTPAHDVDGLLAELEARSAPFGPAPWSHKPKRFGEWMVVDANDDLICSELTEREAAYIAALHNAFPALAAVVRRQAAQLKSAYHRIDKLESALHECGSDVETAHARITTLEAERPRLVECAASEGYKKCFADHVDGFDYPDVTFDYVEAELAREAPEA